MSQVAESYVFSANSQRGPYSTMITAVDLSGPFTVLTQGPGLNDTSEFATQQAAEFYAQHWLDDQLPTDRDDLHGVSGPQTGLEMYRQSANPKYPALITLEAWNRLWSHPNLGGGLWQSRELSEAETVAREKGRGYIVVRVPGMGYGVIHEGVLRQSLEKHNPHRLMGRGLGRHAPSHVPSPMKGDRIRIAPGWAQEGRTGEVMQYVHPDQWRVRLDGDAPGVLIHVYPPIALEVLKGKRGKSRNPRDEWGADLDPQGRTFVVVWKPKRGQPESRQEFANTEDADRFAGMLTEKGREVRIEILGGALSARNPIHTGWVVVHGGTKVGYFGTREEADCWIGQLGVDAAYKEQHYKVISQDEWIDRGHQILSGRKQRSRRNPVEGSAWSDATTWDYSKLKAKAEYANTAMATQYEKRPWFDLVRDAAKHYVMSGMVDSDGVANNRRVKYGFNRWWDELGHNTPTRGYHLSKAQLQKTWGESFRFWDRRRFEHRKYTGRSMGNPAYGQTRGHGWIQEFYETSTRDAGKRTRQVRKLGYRAGTDSMGSQVTPMGSVKMTMVSIAPGASGDEYLENVPDPAGGIVRMNPDCSDRSMRNPNPSDGGGAFDPTSIYPPTEDHDVWNGIRNKTRRQVQALFPGMTRRGFQAADKHFAKRVKASEKRHSKLLNEAALETWGRKWRALDYKISCIGSDKFSTRMKDRLRDNCRMRNRAGDISHAMGEAAKYLTAGRRNPDSYPDSESDAAALYESFHGTPSTQVTEYVEEEQYHEWLTELGTLQSLELVTESGYKALIDFSKDKVSLSSSEDGGQLYFVGGNQQLDLSSLHMSGPKWRKDLMEIGKVWKLTYRTKKAFDKFESIDYFHDVGEETGVLPTLVFDTLNDQIKLAGGQYKIRPEGIVN